MLLLKENCAILFSTYDGNERGCLYGKTEKMQESLR